MLSAGATGPAGRGSCQPSRKLEEVLKDGDLLVLGAVPTALDNRLVTSLGVLAGLADVIMATSSTTSCGCITVISRDPRIFKPACNDPKRTRVAGPRP